MTKDVFRIGNIFYQIFTRYLPYYNHYIEIVFYHFTRKNVSIERKKSFSYQNQNFFCLCKNHGKFGKLVKISERIVFGSGKYLVKILVNILTAAVWIARDAVYWSVYALHGGKKNENRKQE